jgi:hypothetical protein
MPGLIFYRGMFFYESMRLVGYDEGGACPSPLGWIELNLIMILYAQRRADEGGAVYFHTAISEKDGGQLRMFQCGGAARCLKFPKVRTPDEELKPTRTSRSRGARPV